MRCCCPEQLLSLKLTYPTAVYLVRGNHEDRTLNEYYGFAEECSHRLRPQRQARSASGSVATDPGRVVWHTANEMFEWMPLAARIGGRILALHGGLGRTLQSLDQISGLKRPLKIDHGANAEGSERPPSQETHDPPDGTTTPVLGEGALTAARADPVQHLLMDVLWSDPSAHDGVLGVAPNTVRGGATLTYGPDRVRRFCADNDLDMLIRAHECVGDGYQWFAGGRCVTVFSAANYCGIYENDGALLEIDRHLTVLPKVLKARPIAPLPMTEVPEEDEEDEEEAAGGARASTSASGAQEAAGASASAAEPSSASERGAGAARRAPSKRERESRGDGRESRRRAEGGAGGGSGSSGGGEGRKRSRGGADAAGFRPKR